MKDNYGIYVHIPFCKARCGYCAFSSCCNYALQETYFAKICGEITARSDKSVAISTVYLGGGTPSSVEIKYIDVVFDALRQNFDLTAVSEISVECNPESVTEELLVCLKRNGVNRLSFGLQSVNDDTLKRVGRIHRYSDFLFALDLAESLGFDNINADLILGLPERAQDFYGSVKAVAALPLTHVSVYALELHDNTPFSDYCKKYYGYTDDELADMYDSAVSILAANGFSRYEISNFAKKGYECKHNLTYWNENRYYAFGASASGFVGDVRYTNPYGIDDYIRAPVADLVVGGETISRSEQANEYAMLRLRLSNGADTDEFRLRYGIDFFDFFPNALTLVKRGMLERRGKFVIVPDDKIYVVNSILCELLKFD